VLDSVHPFSLVELAFDFIEVFRKAVGAHFVNQPEVLLIL